MGQRNHSKKTCHKVAYNSLEAARQALKDFGRERGCVRVYRCQARNHKTPTYHLTSEVR